SLVAHTIKGVAANLGALKLQATAKTLEEETKEKNTNNYSELIVTLNNDFSTVKKLLEQYIAEKEEVESPKEVNTVVLAKASKKKLSSMGNKIMEFKDRVSAHEYLTTEDVEELNQSCPIDELQQEFEELSAFIENLDFDLADKKVDDILAIIKHGNKSGSVKKRKVGS
ncbi:MAG: Hpt domain-containing protein, partial [Gammaproteobacteria bacterium]|nr:Hpt domain-containing protein [Gammaproteobacteria bacterium]